MRPQVSKSTCPQSVACPVQKKPSEPAKSIVVKVSGVSNESTLFNFFMWSRVLMLNSPVEEAKMSISGTTMPMSTV